MTKTYCHMIIDDKLMKSQVQHCRCMSYFQNVLKLPQDRLVYSQSCLFTSYRWLIINLQHLSSLLNVWDSVRDMKIILALTVVYWRILSYFVQEKEETESGKATRVMKFVIIFARSFFFFICRSRCNSVG
jgi:hypothetical protein